MSCGLVCSGVVMPRCGVVLLLRGASVPGGGGAADGAHTRVHKGTPELQLLGYLVVLGV
jgi:hypothetical protein